MFTCNYAYLKVNIDEQFMRKAKMDAGQCDNSLLDTELSCTVFMEDSSTHVSILTALTESSHLMILGQFIVDLHHSTITHNTHRHLPALAIYSTETIR